MDASKSSFLHRRPFWAVVLGLVALFGCFLFYQFLHDLNSFDSRILSYASASFGGLFWSLLGYKILGTLGEILLTLAYVFSVIYLIRQTFKKDIVLVRYPVILLVLYVLGFVTSIAFFNGL